MSTDRPKEAIMPQNYIERHATDIIKGVALVFMFIHHFFTIPDFYIDGISYPYLEVFAELFKEAFKICVAIFAFLTGYFYVFCKKKNLSYSLKKSTDVWITYLICFLSFLIPAIASGCWVGSAGDVFFEGIGLENKVMVFCWYVDFYIVSMLFLPLYRLAAEKHIVIAVFAGIILPLGIDAVLMETVHIPYLMLDKQIHNILRWFPCVASGYIFAQYNLFQRWFDLLFKKHIKHMWLRVIIASALMLIAFCSRYYLCAINFNVSIFTFNFSMDFLLAPLFVYGLLNIIYAVKRKKLFLPLSVIGEYSLGMWFAHCIFFSVCKEYTQPILYFPKNPILVLLWGLLICLAYAFVLAKATAPIL